jgi:micrococcal nuclease
MVRLFNARRGRNEIVDLRILIIISITFAAWGGPDYVVAQTFSATVKRVIDGDSLLVSTGKRNVEVRLYGIDAPEFDQPYADITRKFVKKWSDHQLVQVQAQYKDSYGRTVAIILKGRRILNEDLVQAGLAWVYPRYCRKDMCEQWAVLETIARDEKRGLWQGKPAIAPWRWKRNRKGR